MRKLRFYSLSEVRLKLIAQVSCPRQTDSRICAPEKTLESPLDCKEIQPVHSKGDQPWDFFGRNDAKAETPLLWPPHAKSWLIGKNSDAGRDWGQKEKGTTEDEMAGWHHGLDGRESKWIPGVGDGQGGLACCNSWGRKELDTTERLNWTESLLPGLHFFTDVCVLPLLSQESFKVWLFSTNSLDGFKEFFYLPGICFCFQ